MTHHTSIELRIPLPENINKLNEYIHDLNLKCEVLEQKYKTMELLNNEYIKRISELEEQNEDLKCALQSNLNQFDSKQFINLRFAEMSESIANHNSEIHRLRHKIRVYFSENKSLKSENSDLKNNISKYREALEVGNRQKETRKMILFTKSKFIDTLQSEIQHLRDELSQKTDELSQKNIESTPQPQPPKILPDQVSPDCIRTLAFMKTMESLNKNPYSLAVSITSPTSVATPMYFEYGNENSEAQTPMMEEMEKRLWTLDMENENLIQKIQTLEKCEHKKEKSQSRQSFVFLDDGKWALSDEYDSDENDEMETLFKKCEKEILRQKSDLHNRYRKIFG